MSTHYCGDDLENWSIWLKADDCDHEKENNHEDHKDICCEETVAACDLQVKTENCCSTNSQMYVLEDDVVAFEKHSYILCLNSVKVFYTFVMPIFNLSEEEDLKIDKRIITPPLLDATSPEVIQCFII